MSPSPAQLYNTVAAQRASMQLEAQTALEQKLVAEAQPAAANGACAGSSGVHTGLCACTRMQHLQPCTASNNCICDVLPPKCIVMSSRICRHSLRMIMDGRQDMICTNFAGAAQQQATLSPSGDHPPIHQGARHTVSAREQLHTRTGAVDGVCNYSAGAPQNAQTRDVAGTQSTAAAGLDAPSTSGLPRDIARGPTQQGVTTHALQDQLACTHHMLHIVARAHGACWSMHALRSMYTHAAHRRPPKTLLFSKLCILCACVPYAGLQGKPHSATPATSQAPLKHAPPSSVLEASSAPPMPSGGEPEEPEDDSRVHVAHHAAAAVGGGAASPGDFQAPGGSASQPNLGAATGALELLTAMQHGKCELIVRCNPSYVAQVRSIPCCSASPRMPGNTGVLD